MTRIFDVFHTRAAALVLAALTLAGCLQSAPEARPASVDATPTVDIVTNRPDTTFGAVETGPAVGPDANATTALAPRLVKGEWWKIDFASPFYAGTSEVVRVVADATPEGYVFGMPHEGWFKEAISYHAPAFGDVNLDLSYDTHNLKFEPVRFPLAKGATWKTVFATANLTATVESADEHTAVVRFDPPPSAPQPTDPVFAALSPVSGGGMRLTYDARQHEVIKFESEIGTWQVVEHGYGFTGWVTIPRGEHTAIDYGQFLPVTPGGPVVTRTQTVAGGFNRLTMLHLIAPLGPGAYRIRSTTPNGTEFSTESIAGKGLTIKFYEASNPDGEWKLEDLVGGPGATYSMGIAYHQYDIRLPDGARRSDHSHAVIR